MLGSTAHQQLTTAAAPALKRIHQDRQGAPPRIQPLLAYLEKHLYDPGLDATQLMLACGVRDHGMSMRFHSSFGEPPAGYIRRHRLETAQRLLRDSELEVWKIAELVGYSGVGVFSRAFKTWCGQRPTVYRQDSRRERGSELASSPSDLTPASAGPTIDSEILKVGCEGGWGEAEAVSYLGQLLAIYPSSAPRAIRRWFENEVAQESGLEAAEADEERMAKRAWRVLEKLPWNAQKETVRHRLQLKTSALFELLCAKSLELGRVDRERGIAIARLALESIDGLDRDATSSEMRAGLRVRGWAAVGNASRLACDFPTAEKAFERGERFLGVVTDQPLIRAGFLDYKAGLCWAQNRLEEALDLVGRSLPLFRRFGEPQQIAQSLLIKGIIHQEDGEPELAMGSLNEAAELVADGKHPYFLFAANYELTRCYAMCGRLERARWQLDRTCELAEKQGSWTEDLQPRLCWLEGLVARESGRLEVAASCFLASRDAWMEQGFFGEAGMTSLDLAVVYMQLGRGADALEPALRTFLIFDGLKLGREVLAALRVLQDAVADEKLSLAILEQTRASLAKVQNTPAFALASRPDQR